MVSLMGRVTLRGLLLRSDKRGSGAGVHSSGSSVGHSVLRQVIEMIEPVSKKWVEWVSSS